MPAMAYIVQYYYHLYNNMIQSVDRALNILKKVAFYNDWVGVREIARSLDLKVPTVQNLLKTLANHAFLEFDETSRRYRVGIAPLLLAEHMEPLSRMANFCHPYLESIFNEFGETTTACTMLSRQIIVVDSKTSNEPLTVIHPRRVIEHPHCLASGKMLLSVMGEAFIDKYAETEFNEDLGPNTPRTAAELKVELARVKKRGYAEAINIRAQGIAAVAVPVYGPGGKPALTIACSAPVSRFGDEQRARVRQRLQETAGTMSKQLGI